MKDDKAPDRDGFNATFIKIYWDIIQNDLFKMVTKSQKCDKVGGSTNSSFLALIPKEKRRTPLTGFAQSPYATLGTR